jgi:hypothetical protein
MICKCDEISVYGFMGCSAKHWENFLRVDDEGNIIIPTIIDKDDNKELAVEENFQIPISKPSQKELLDELSTQLERLNNLPTNALLNVDELKLSITIIKELFETKDNQ